MKHPRMLWKLRELLAPNWKPIKYPVLYVDAFWQKLGA